VSSAGIAAFSPTLHAVLRRNRFADLVRRQLDLFEEDTQTLLAEAEEADAAWTHAGSEDAEELYGDYLLVVDVIAEKLLDVRDAYATTLEEAAAEEYRAAFDRAASKRFGRYAALLDDETT
jgi:hypothetical protein